MKQEMLFEWQDGPLIEAMQFGGVFLIDEISLAEDSVLERLNSVLEPEKKILVPEKGGSNIEEIQACESFVIVATMNPGGDFGKRELSAALRNRFTEIWVESLLNKKFLGTMTQDNSGNRNLVFEMIRENLQKRIKEEGECSDLAMNIYEFVEIVNGKLCEGLGLETKGLSMRDVIGMIDFVEKTRGILRNSNDLCFETFQMMTQNIVGFLGLGEHERNTLHSGLTTYLSQRFHRTTIINDFSLKLDYFDHMKSFGMSPFVIPVNPATPKESLMPPNDRVKFSVKSSLVMRNLYNILRSLQVNKAILLEGPPGSGKSSLIEYLAERTGRKLLRITLTEQTDIIDLLGSDFPTDSTETPSQQKESKKGRFKWYDGIILDALRNGHWLLLEELNLANQSILEGLNAILDHRGSVFVPEINKTFEKHENFRLFTTQCPINLGGGRKGLPVSFLNRFNKQYVEDFGQEDLLEILKDCFPEIDVDFIRRTLTFAK